MAIDGAGERFTGTPGACDNPGTSETPSTEHNQVVFGGRAATVFPHGPPGMSFETERIDSHTRDAEARTSTVSLQGMSSASDVCELTPEVHLCTQSASAAEPFSKEAARKRLERMVFGDRECPRASGLDRATDKQSAAFMVAVREGAGDLWSDREDDVKRAFAPALIDEVDLVAYLAADGLGRPLMHPDDTNALGKRALTQATRAAAAIKAAERTAGDAVRRAKAAAASDPSKLPRVAAVEAKGAVDLAAVRDKVTPDLHFPARTVGKRKRNAEAMPAPPPPPLPPAPQPPPQVPQQVDETFEAAVARAVREELAKQEAARVEAVREAEAARVAAREEAREEAARAAVPLARSGVAAAERALKRAKRAVAQHPVPEFDEPRFQPPPGITTHPSTFPAWKVAHDEYHERVFRPYSTWWHAEFSRHWDLQGEVGQAEVELECAQEDLVEAEAAVPRRASSA